MRKTELLLTAVLAISALWLTAAGTKAMEVLPGEAEFTATRSEYISGEYDGDSEDYEDDELEEDEDDVWDDDEATGAYTGSEDYGISLASTYTASYVDWESNSWSASFDGSNLILSFNIAFYATGNGSEYYLPKYYFGTGTGNSTPSNILYCTNGGTDSSAMSSGAGTLSFSSFTRTAGTSDRYFKMTGTVTVDSDYLSKLDGASFRYTAGGWGGSGDNSWEARESGNYTISNFDTAFAQAQCAHSSWTYSSNGSGGHKAVCSSCGYSKTESHSLSSGKCTKCSYTESVSVTIKYVLNGKTITETLSLTPGSSYKPKDVEGYKSHAAITVPSSGGTVSITMEPISYKVIDMENTYTVDYDESLFIPKQEQKGYVHKGYTVKSVT